ncbi:MAG TPA: serine/threonine protein kinase, partial [Planctomycetaceae bacterium]|nr:serine/threonine protein kinase [Planctomycetaceae bacterium]
LVTGIAPLTGQKLWEIEGATTECVTSTVTNGELILTSGGYPKNHMSAVKADGSGEVVWENSNRMYVPSMLIQDNNIYSVTDNGVAVCWDVKTGKELWKGRLGGTFSSSPVLVGDRIYVTNEAGETYIFKASPDEFELLGENKLGTEVFATPTFCDSRIYMRVSQEVDGKRQEMLYCIGKK